MTWYYGRMFFSGLGARDPYSYDVYGRERWGSEAAGLMLITQRRNVLLTLRSRAVMDPGVWGIPGGRLEPRHVNAFDAALLETEEELGEVPLDVLRSIQPMLVDTLISGGFNYKTFVAWVDEDALRRWTPTLNWENDDYQLFHRIDLEGVALHPNVKRVLDRIGFTQPRWKMPDQRVWHVTDIESANSILRNGFEPRSQKGLLGTSVSLNYQSAAGLFRTLSRMNRFYREPKEAVADWFVSRGADRERVDRIIAWHNRLVSEGKREDDGARLYISMMADLHPSVGGKADIPWNEFLWSDIGTHLIGKQIVLLEALLGSTTPFDVTRLREEFTDECCEAELFVPDPYVQQLEPTEMRLGV